MTLIKHPLFLSSLQLLQSSYVTSQKQVITDDHKVTGFSPLPSSPPQSGDFTTFCLLHTVFLHYAIFCTSFSAIALDIYVLRSQKRRTALSKVTVHEKLQVCSFISCSAPGGTSPPWQDYLIHLLSVRPLRSISLLMNGSTLPRRVPSQTSSMDRIKWRLENL